MIRLIRVDERMIHGQVAIKWTKLLGVNRVLVINDEASKSELLKKSLLMAAPQDVKCAVMGMQEGIDILNNPKAAELKIFVIVRTPQDALEIYRSINDSPELNLGNYGRIAPRENNEPRKGYRINLYLYDSEVQVIKEILDMGIKCNYQVIPEDRAEPLERLI